MRVTAAERNIVENSTGSILLREKSSAVQRHVVCVKHTARMLRVNLSCSALVASVSKNQAVSQTECVCSPHHRCCY